MRRIKELRIQNFKAFQKEEVFDPQVDIPEYTDPRTGDSDPPQKVLVL
jgi:hypothetical protein